MRRNRYHDSQVSVKGNVMFVLQIKSDFSMLQKVSFGSGLDTHNDDEDTRSQ